MRSYDAGKLGRGIAEFGKGEAEGGSREGKKRRWEAMMLGSWEERRELRGSGCWLRVARFGLRVYIVD